MKKYYILLLSLTALLVLAAFAVLWTNAPLFQMVMPFLPLYFALVTGLQHYAVVTSMHKDPRTFVKNFLGLTVGSLFLHLVVLSVWAFTHIHQAHAFIVAFCICYILYLVFETVALVLLVKSKRRK